MRPPLSPLAVNFLTHVRSKFANGQYKLCPYDGVHKPSDGDYALLQGNAVAKELNDAYNLVFYGYTHEDLSRLDADDRLAVSYKLSPSLHMLCVEELVDLAKQYKK